jgi:inner membrane protein
MQGRTHALIGAAAGLLLAVQVAAPAESTAMFVAAGALGGLLPDVDHPQSSINQKLPFIRLFTFWLPHRTLTHSVFAIALMMFTGLWFAGFYGAAMGAGYALHVAADMLTRSGVPFLCPFSDFRWHLLPRGLRLTTGGMVEQVIAAGVSLLVLYEFGLVFGVV